MTTLQTKKIEGIEAIDMFTNLTEKQQQILFGFALGLEAKSRLEPMSDTVKSQQKVS